MRNDQRRLRPTRIARSPEAWVLIATLCRDFDTLTCIVPGMVPDSRKEMRLSLACPDAVPLALKLRSSHATRLPGRYCN